MWTVSSEVKKMKMFSPKLLKDLENVEKVVEDMFSGVVKSRYSYRKMGVDELVIEFEVPGLTREQIEVSIDGSWLKVRAQNRIKDVDGNYAFSETFNVSEYDTSKAECSLDSGILTVAIPKKKKDSNSRKLEIK